MLQKKKKSRLLLITKLVFKLNLALILVPSPFFLPQTSENAPELIRRSHQTLGPHIPRVKWLGSASLYLFNWVFTPTHFKRLPRCAVGKETACQCRRPKFDPWVGKIPWRRKWQPTPVFLPEKSHGQRSLMGYSPQGRKESDTTELTHAHAIMEESLWTKTTKGRSGRVCQPGR